MVVMVCLCTTRSLHFVCMLVVIAFLLLGIHRLCVVFIMYLATHTDLARLLNLATCAIISFIMNLVGVLSNVVPTES